MATTPFKVKAVYEYTSPHEDDLHFPNGQIITVTDIEDEDWYAGEYVDAQGVTQEGIFPKNFVEKYEPQAPPRPVRTSRPKKESEHVTEAAPAPTAPAPTPAQEPAPAPAPAPALTQAEEATRVPPHGQDAAQHEGPKSASVSATKPVEETPVAAPPKPAPAAKSPPPVTDKPSSGSFRDRIAAFNKTAAPPPVPYKQNPAGSSFIKKPFVPPPPSKNAYIPPPRDVPVTKIYRRDEDPEIAAKEQENQESAEKAGLAPSTDDNEDQPKPTSLKERIVLLQKQQAEQAARHADAAVKKEKPKRPPTKKRTDSFPIEENDAPLEKQESHDTVGRRSVDSSRDEIPDEPPRRKSHSRVRPALPVQLERDGNEADMSGAGDETEELDTGLEDSDVNTRPKPVRAPTHEADVGDEEDVASEEEAADEDEEDDIDPEVRRKEEIRARMAKMSGGMGMHGMFGPPGGMPMPMPPPAPKRKKSTAEKQNPEDHEHDESSPTSRAAPVSIMALPGMAKVRSPEESHAQIDEEDVDTPHVGPITAAHEPDEVPDIEDVAPPAPTKVERPIPNRASMSQNSFSAPPIPGGRPAPPPVPVDSRPLSPPVAPLKSPSPGSESDDELSQSAFNLSLQTPTNEAAKPAPPALPSRENGPGSPTAMKSYFTEPTPTSPTSTENRRASRVPPIPGSSPVVHSRPVPPLPPNPSISRSSTGDARIDPPTPIAQDQSEEEITEYEGDYDTDIAPTASHKDALKSTKEPHDEHATISHGTPAGAPPLPPSAPRGGPPPLPSQPPPHRQSSDMPRGVPPPPPVPKHDNSAATADDDDEYDPYNYSAPKSHILAGAMGIGRAAPMPEEDDYDDLYSASPPQPPAPTERPAPPPPPRELGHPPVERAVPPPPHAAPPPIERAVPPPPPQTAPRAAHRQSVDVQRGQARRSMDLNRLVQEHDFIANDIDLGHSTLWWSQANGLPPALQGRKDILYESEESTASKRGGKSITTKDLYVLYPDYSQTIITVNFDTQNVSDASLEQRHEAPPAKLRQDQLEEFHERFGRRLQEAVSSKKDSVVGDGTPTGLILELLKPLKDALLPIGNRAYGALVYSNQGNSLTSQFDEIRPGDIVAFRNAKFQGKHGPMHAKYTAEVGKGEGHVGIVAEWDGPKKKVRAWEQGRESKKVKVESFKLEDLRSGEVKIWRVIGRGCVGWEGQNS